MALSTPLRVLLSLGIVTVLAICSGARADAGHASTAAPQVQGGAESLNVRLRALATGGGSTAAAAGPITNEQFFQWAGQILATEFPANPVARWLVAEGLVWDVRAYANGNYLAVADNGRAYALGPATGNALVDLGSMQAFADPVCARVDCSGGGGAGPANLFLCGIPLPSRPPGYGEVCARPPGAGPQVLPDPICLGTRDCDISEASVSIRTYETYRGPLTGTLLFCMGNPGLDVPPQCRAPTSNDASHLGMIAFRFNGPNGGVGPSTSVTFQVLTSTDAVALNRCVPVGASPYTVFSDANTLRISDTSGRHLYITIRTSGTAC
jgi:hypothetical protein